MTQTVPHLAEQGWSGMVFAVLIPLKEGEMEHTVTVLVVQHARIVTIDRVVHPGAQSALRRLLSMQTE